MLLYKLTEVWEKNSIDSTRNAPRCEKEQITSPRSIQKRVKNRMLARHLIDREDMKVRATGREGRRVTTPDPPHILAKSHAKKQNSAYAQGVDFIEINKGTDKKKMVAFFMVGLSKL